MDFTIFITDMLNRLWASKLLESADFWVLVSFIGFVILMLYFRLPARLGAVLNQQRQAIIKDLDEAQSLYQEALDLLQTHQRKIETLSEELETLTQTAKTQNMDYEREYHNQLAEKLKRQEQAANRRIEQARALALSAIRQEASHLALQAAKKLIAEQCDQARQMDRSIAQIQNLLSQEK